MRSDPQHSRRPHAHWRLPDINAHRLWALLIVGPVVVAVHALGVFTLSEVGHGGMLSDQRISLAIGGFVVIAVFAKLFHVAGLGALGAGVLRLRDGAMHKSRAAGQRLQTPDRDN
jgi:hypothetical protein